MTIRSIFLAGALLAGVSMPVAARAQMQFSFGGGWTTMSAAPPSQPYMRPFNASAAMSPIRQGPVRWRLDLVALDYQVSAANNLNHPDVVCLPDACQPQPPAKASQGLSLGLLAYAHIDLVPDGRAYLLTGAGMYRLQFTSQPVSVRPGGTFGAGVNIPFSHSAEMFVEARWMGVNGAITGPSWYLPVTVGFRSR